MRAHRKALCLVTTCVVALGLNSLTEAQQARDGSALEWHFGDDPNWDGFRNRLTPSRVPHVKQDFGFRRSHLAGGAGAGEIGGTIHRTTRHAFFGKKIDELTLNDKLSASGTFAVTRADSGSGVMFGWFNESARGWRTPNSLAFRIDGNGAKYWMFYEYGTRNWLTGGGGAFEGDRYQTTKTMPFRADGTPHRWSLTYEPRQANEAGLITFRVDDRTYTQEVPTDHKADGATFNRFGIWNVQAAGESLDVFFDDVVMNGESMSFDADPQWSADGNETEFDDRIIRPFHDFGYSLTNHAGGEPGEIGGLIFRDDRPAYYAAKIEPVSLDDELEVSGKLAFLRAGSDSGIRFGFFNAASKQGSLKPEYDERQKNLLAITVEGPSRVGHYFRAGYATATGDGEAPLADPFTGRERPLIKPDGKSHRWSLRYSPTAANGRGQITVTLDNETHTLDLREGARQQGATFDRFGLLNIQAGGHHVELYLDEIKYGWSGSR